MAEQSAEIFAAFAERLRAYLRARTRSHDDAEDLLMEVFERVLRNESRLDDIEHMSGWLHRIAHNVLVDHYRKQKPRPEPEPNEHALDDDGDELLHAGIAKCLAGFVDELEPNYREALTLVELNGMTQRAAADALGLSVPGMKSRVQRGRRKLRERFLACCEVDLDRRRRVVDCRAKSALSSPGDL